MSLYFIFALAMDHHNNTTKYMPYNYNSIWTFVTSLISN